MLHPAVRKDMPARNRSAKLFVSYRRDDSAGHAGWLCDRLRGHFGPERLFMDIDTIRPGEDFVSVLENAVASCEILIAVIGRYWLASAEGGVRRIDRPDDFVRLEIRAALDRGITVIPVLVHGASMPRPEELPAELKPLTRRNALELTDSRWGFDISKLIATIEEELAAKPAAEPFQPRLREYILGLRHTTAGLTRSLRRLVLAGKSVWLIIALPIILLATIAVSLMTNPQEPAGTPHKVNGNSGPVATVTPAVTKPVERLLAPKDLAYAMKATQYNVDKGTVNVRASKAMLQKMDLYSGEVDDTIDEPFINAVWRFQDRRGLKLDGALGEVTFKALVKPASD